MNHSSLAQASRQTRSILVGVAAGIGVGLAINVSKGALPWLDTVLVQMVFKLVGDVFRNGLSLLVVPLVFFSPTAGVASLKDPAELGRLGWKIIALYMVTTAVTIAMALFLAITLEPGVGVDQATVAYTPPNAPPGLLTTLTGMVTTNPVRSLAEGNMLQVILFCILLGLALVMSGEPGRRVTARVQDWSEVVMRLVTIVMCFAPIGVFALLAREIATLGFDTILKLIKYFLLVLFAQALQLFVAFPIMLRLGGLPPGPWLRKMREVWLYAFSTSSSNATLPVNIRVVEQRLGASPGVTAFALPLGATVNMNGTAIMQGVATVFIAQVYGVELTLVQLLTVVGMATLAAIGTAGVPSAGIVMLALVLTQVGLPIEGIALVLAVDRLLDMARTVVNVSGDAAVTCIVAKMEGELDETVYRSR
ncbi:MAG: dicarboxylate/amino acid:cation symporter [Steroidobacteraceae bacterium]|nr:dicarboxylate/amino acid:cation symporter [Steroidobacteraceae bacterium]